MKRIHILALFGLVAAAVAGCSDTSYDRDDGYYGYHRDYDHDRYRRDRDEDNGYAGDRDRDHSYWRDGRRYCRDQDGDEYPC